MTIKYYIETMPTFNQTDIVTQTHTHIGHNGVYPRNIFNKIFPSFFFKECLRFYFCCYTASFFGRLCSLKKKN